MKTANMHRVLICGACAWLVQATPAEARFLQVDPIGYQDQVNLYAYVGNDPLNYFDPGGTDSRVTPNGIVIIPSRVGIPSVTIPRVQGAEGINYFRTGVAHLYKIDLEHRPRITDPQSATDRLMGTPTPGPISNMATGRGTLNDVGPLVPGDGGDNFVMSFRASSPDPTRYTDIIVNYTIGDRHALDEGFVMRYGTINAQGQVDNIVTYGEGNNWKQDPVLADFWLPPTKDAWQSLNRRIGF